MDQVYHKYRMTVARSKAVIGESSNRSIGKVLVCLDPEEPASYVLLHLTQLARLRDPNRKNLDLYEYVHISFSGYEISSELLACLKHYGVHLRIVKVEDIVVGSQALLDSHSSLNTRDELQRVFRMAALLEIAKSNDTSVIYLSENCSSLAATIIADTSTGRGMSLPWRLGATQFYFPSNIHVVRPLREVVDLEISHYLSLITPPFQILGLIMKKFDVTESRDGGEKEYKEIYALSADFIRELDRDNSATVSTVTRTTAKIKTAISGALMKGEWKPCALCLCPLHIDHTSESTSEVILLSSKETFCYACHELLEDANSDKNASIRLPQYSFGIISGFGKNRNYSQ